MAIKIEDNFEETRSNQKEIIKMSKKSKNSNVNRNKELHSNFTTNSNFERKSTDYNIEKIYLKNLIINTNNEKVGNKKDLLNTIISKIDKNTEVNRKNTNKNTDYYLQYSTFKNQSHTTKHKDKLVKKITFNETVIEDYLSNSLF